MRRVAKRVLELCGFADPRHLHVPTDDLLRRAAGRRQQQLQHRMRRTRRRRHAHLVANGNTHLWLLVFCAAVSGHVGLNKNYNSPTASSTRGYYAR
ncbi:hypothetical protein WH91_09290 [Devosia psychrophila]|uniref:Transposase n=1 Tax=Devosia psychrophila TaxID=728005 RepID=A0ABR5DYX4_9HYPH|nr:hypothetical protein WH91_09290 [Devosia psychrophila]